jgi:hypothetical protein
MSANQNQTNNTSSDPTGNPSDPTPKPRRRDILASMALGLVGLPMAPIRDPAKAAEARRLIDAWRQLKEDNDDAFVIEQAEGPAGCAICEFLGMDLRTRERFAVEYAGRLLVVELGGFPGTVLPGGEIVFDYTGRPGATIDEVDLGLIGKL